MSKEQMMAGFDELLTDRRLTRARAEAHLMACADEPSLLAGRYVCLASGGSSGLRGTRGCFNAPPPDWHDAGHGSSVVVARTLEPH